MKIDSLGIEAGGGGEMKMCVRHAEFDKTCFECWQHKVAAENGMEWPRPLESPTFAEIMQSFEGFGGERNR